MFVDVLAGRRGNVWGDGQVEIRQEEEDGDGESGVDRGSPVRELALRFGEINVHETSGDKHVDNRERVGDQAGNLWSETETDLQIINRNKKNILEKEVIGISRRGSKHDDHGDNVMLQETSSGGVERPIAGP